MAPVLPVYDGTGITGLVPALLGARPAEWLPEPVRDATSTVLLVLDGLGWDAVQTHRDELPVLAGLTGGPTTTVVPSTTSTALTSLTTGLPPSRHGVVGYRIRLEESVLNVLSWHGEGRRPPDAHTFQRHAPFLGRQVPVVTKSEFRGSGFSAVHYGDAEFHGWSAMSSLVEHCRALVGSGAPFVYAYYPGIDSVAHKHGLRDEFYAAELRAADRLVGDLLDALPPSTALVVTADHGQVHLEAEDWISLGSLASLIDVCSGDGRFRYLHARPGAAKELVAAARSEHGAQAWVRSRAELLDDGWLGPDPTPIARGRLGDVVLAANTDVGFLDPALPHENRLRSAHGSLTSAEMLVPVLAARGRAGT